MAAAFDNQRLRQQGNGVIDGDTQPQVIIFAYRQGFIEATAFNQ